MTGRLNIMNRLTSEEIKSIAGAGEGYNAEFKVRVPSKVKEPRSA
jgi:ATP-dependent DNA helicase RecG